MKKDKDVVRANLMQVCAAEAVYVLLLALVALVSGCSDRALITKAMLLTRLLLRGMINLCPCLDYES